MTISGVISSAPFAVAASLKIFSTICLNVSMISSKLLPSYAEIAILSLFFFITKRIFKQFFFHTP